MVNRKLRSRVEFRGMLILIGLALLVVIIGPLVNHTGPAGFVFSGIMLLIFALCLIIQGLLLLIWRSGRWRWINAFRMIIIIGLLIIIIAGWTTGMVNGLRYLGARDLLAGTDRYVAVIVCDGANLGQARDLFMKGLDDPKQYATAVSKVFPTISKTFMQNGAYSANGLSVWPSSSIPAHTGIMTGCYPRITGVMGQRQFRPSTLLHSSYIGIGISALKKILPKQVKTLCECFPNTRSLVVLQIANRGASLYVPTTPSDEEVIKRMTQVVEATSLLGRVTKKQEVPRILVVTLPDIDHQTHNMPFIDKRAIEVYQAQDKHLAAIFDLYKRMGVFDKTLFVLCADHGMEQVKNHVTIDNLMHDMRFKVYQSMKWTLVPQWGSFEANFWVGRKVLFADRYNGVSLWGGNSDGIIYVRGQERDAAGNIVKDSWDIHPTDENLHAYSVGGDTVDVIQRLLSYSPGIGLVMTNPQKHVFNVYSETGQGQITERDGKPFPEFKYKIIKGNDPLRYITAPHLRAMIMQDRWYSDAQWAEATYLQHYPDAIRRIAYSFENPNSGHMNIVAADGWDFAPYYVTWHVLSGSHGSLNQAASLVPIMFYGPGVKKVELPYARTVDILPTILAYLDAENVTTTNGRVLPIFNDKQKNSLITDAPANMYKTEATSDGKYEYWLANTYASYDQKLVRQDKSGGKQEVLVENIQAALPSLHNMPNVKFEIEKIDNGRVIMRKVYVGVIDANKEELVIYDTAQKKLSE